MSPRSLDVPSEPLILINYFGTYLRAATRCESAAITVKSRRPVPDSTWQSHCSRIFENTRNVSVEIISRDVRVGVGWVGITIGIMGLRMGLKKMKEIVMEVIVVIGGKGGNFRGGGDNNGGG